MQRSLALRLPTGQACLGSRTHLQSKVSRSTFPVMKQWLLGQHWMAWQCLVPNGKPGVDLIRVLQQAAPDSIPMQVESVEGVLQRTGDFSVLISSRRHHGGSWVPLDRNTQYVYYDACNPTPLSRGVEQQGECHATKLPQIQTNRWSRYGRAAHDHKWHRLQAPA